ncbi:hypothetical protein LENED_007479 [Lentinula edodes]|uniref:Uncharacterized protein n=1 Tax=Lentinula edodes TaxID=5353 RepID=A0A1Q3EEL5_LENED|nr:hypothetical protein LENED_007479 [Lentinula edodes]
MVVVVDDMITICWIPRRKMRYETGKPLLGFFHIWASHMPESRFSPRQIQMPKKLTQSSCMVLKVNFD